MHFSMNNSKLSVLFETFSLPFLPFMYTNFMLYLSKRNFSINNSFSYSMKHLLRVFLPFKLLLKILINYGDVMLSIFSFYYNP